MEIEDLKSRAQTLEFTNEEERQIHQKANEEHEKPIALLNDDLQERYNRVQAIQYKNVGLQDEIRAKDQQIATLQRCYVGYLSNEDKNTGIRIIARNKEEAEYPYMSICEQHGYRRHKTRLLLARDQGNTLFADGDTRNAIVTYSFWREHRLTVVDSNRPRRFRLDAVNRVEKWRLSTYYSTCNKTGAKAETKRGAKAKADSKTGAKTA